MDISAEVGNLLDTDWHEYERLNAILWEYLHPLPRSYSEAVLGRDRPYRRQVAAPWWPELNTSVYRGIIAFILQSLELKGRSLSPDHLAWPKNI
jgi:hypothetical protein